MMTSSGIFQTGAEKIKLEIDDSDDFGFTTVTNNTKTAYSVEAVEAVLKRVFTFLDKLAENPDKDIHWPNRAEKIEKFKKELMDMLHK